jgi:hypothetical protein
MAMEGSSFADTKGGSLWGEGVGMISSWECDNHFRASLAGRTDLGDKKDINSPYLE